MQTSLRFIFSAALAIVTLSVPSVYGGEADYKMEKSVIESGFPFEKGAHEVQVGAGAFFSFSRGGDIRPQMDYALVNVRYGIMLSTPADPGFLRGNWEFLVDVYGGGVFDGPSGGLAGASLLLRYNFVQENARFVPYFQIGAGGLYNTIYQNTPQRLIGGPFEWNLEGSFGLRYMCSDRCAIYIEGGYRHISNANFYDRNNGLNAVGGMLGVSWFF